MICLTGDVHHRSMNSLNQNYFNSSDNEVKLAQTYLEIAEKYNLKVTLFITGRAFTEEFDDIKELLKFKNLEIAGHGFNANLPDFYYRFKLFTKNKCGYLFSKQYYKFNKLMTLCGHESYIRKDIERTLNIIKEKTNLQVNSWRSHAYTHSDKKMDMLNTLGLTVVSDDINKNALLPQEYCENLTSLPINTMPDHDHIFHGARTRQYFSKGKWKGTNFGSQMYDVDQWLDIIKDQITKIVNNQGIATISAHPECMYLADKFNAFEKLCQFLSQYQSIFAQESHQYLKNEN